jgi:hypothetical protein
MASVKNDSLGGVASQLREKLQRVIANLWFILQFKIL